MRKIPFNEQFFDEDCPKAFYWAGFIAADGWVEPKRSRFGLCQNDKAHIELFLNDIGSEPRAINKKEQLNPFYSVSITIPKDDTSLSRFGIIPQKLYNMKFPEWLKSHHLCSHYLRGYFDGDGSIYFSGKDPVIEFCGTPDFLNGVRDTLLQSFDFQATVHPRKGKEHTGTFSLTESTSFKKLDPIYTKMPACSFSEKPISSTQSANARPMRPTVVGFGYLSF